jgi:hypothetical protein
MFYECKNFTGLSHHKKWSCISSWDTHNVVNMTCMLEGAVLFIAKIHDWDVSHVVYCKDFNKNCCHMRRNLPSFSKEAMQLELTVPLNVFEDSPIIDSSKQMTPLTYEASLSPLRFSPPHQLIRSTNTLIGREQPPVQLPVRQSPVRQSPVRQTPVRQSPVRQSPEVEFLGVRRPSPEVEFLGVRRPSPEVEFLGVRRPRQSSEPSPEVEYLGTRRVGGTRKKKKKNKRKSMAHR